MALANVAFLAAMNGLNVLVMDWDLEAPGLHHYFRGLMEPDEMADLRSASGVLDLAWEWRNGVEAAQTAADVDQHFTRFTSGAPFEAAVRTIMDANELEGRSRLDIIPAGSDEVATPTPVEYERALAAFSWSDFIDKYAGGGMIESLRDWATSHYDLVLVDSRTGLADVAGICTMQIPDAVVLAFVLNRQNIEGVARVASAIKSNRGDEVKIWTVPMRVSREGTDEEADATARALRELTRPGRLERSATERDLNRLLIKAEPNIPFMESLSAFNDTNAALDPLTANMARLATEITGVSITIPEISEHWRDVVASRLAPTLSTDAYLRQLLTAEPGRAARQLHGYVESAISTLWEGDEVPEDYVTALAETSFALQQRGDVYHDGDVAYDTVDRIALLLKRLYERDAERWRPLLIQALESSLDSEANYLGADDEVVALDEIDELLGAEEQSASVIERRANIRMRAARLFEAMGDHVLQLAAAEEALAHIAAGRRLATTQSLSMRLSRLEALLQKASAREGLEQLDEAIEDLRKILKSLPEVENEETQAEAARIAFEANFRLMRVLRLQDPNSREIGRHALAAIERAHAQGPLFLSRAAEIADAITNATPPFPLAASLLLQRLLISNLSATVHFFSRAPAGSGRFIDALGRLLEVAREGDSREQMTSFVSIAADMVVQLLRANEHRLIATARRGLFRTRPPTSLAAAIIGASHRFISVADVYRSEPEVDQALEHLTATISSLTDQLGPLSDSPAPRRWPAS